MIKTLNYIFFFSLLILISCQKQAHWNTNVITPLINSRLDVGDIFGDTNVQVNPDQSWSVVVQQKFDMLQTNSAVNLDDTISKDIFNLPFTFTIPPGQKVIEKQNVTPLNFEGMELSFARSSIARMKFYVTNTIKHRLLVKYTLHSATKDGVVYEAEEDIPAASDTANAIIEKTINLDNYDIDLTGPQHNSFNSIYATTTVWVHPDGDTAVIGPTDTLIIVSTFDKFEPDYARGFIGSEHFHERGASALHAFDDFKSGSFDLQNVNAVLDINNYIGADLTATINEFSTKNIQTNTTISLANPIIGSSINIIRATESNIPSYPVYSKNYTFDLSNSNIDKMIEVMPDSLIYDITADVNPLGNISAGNDFVYFDKSLEAILKLDIPLNFSSDNLLIEDYSNLNFDSENINFGMINIYLDNSFPFSVNIQFYLLDDQDNIMDSLLLKNRLVPAANIDANGFVISPKSTKLEIKVDDNLMHSMKISHRMLIRANINSEQNQKYKLYEDYGMDIKMVGDLSYGI